MTTIKQSIETTTKKYGFAGPDSSEEDCNDTLADSCHEEYYSEEWGTNDQG